MATVVDLVAWREDREPGMARLERAVAELDEVVRGRRRGVPDWAVTEILAIQGCISLDLLEDAAERAELLAGRLRRWRARK